MDPERGKKKQPTHRQRHDVYQEEKNSSLTLPTVKEKEQISRLAEKKSVTV